ncbi:S1 family peptidase [Prauserella muralis]|uniref:Serine protease n=1 Tax=Prauserella muralis TaxID=588067 RepID=A0A2V4ALL7_9PSEU|nr:serine protease [Prauserella muralis]PXY21191.1 serine protease [Prauserella muralis]TWE30292.1 trypsin [Prauserella muralis]
MGRVRSRLAGALAAVSVLALVGVPIASAVQPSIVGGVPADQPYPFAVSLQQNSGEHFCGGALVAAEWVVTAAHCVQGREPAEFSARIGSLDRTQGGEVIEPAQVLPHPDYDPDGAGGDVALVRLASPAQAEPIALATGAEVGVPTRILGWGQTCPTEGCGTSPVTLQQLDTSVVDGAGCTAVFDPAVELCTGNPEGRKGACYGDSGGPEIIRAGERWLLAGVSSRPGVHDATCGTGPSIYTSVVAYTPWITEHVAPPPPSPQPTSSSQSTSGAPPTSGTPSPSGTPPATTPTPS